MTSAVDRLQAHSTTTTPARGPIAFFLPTLDGGGAERALVTTAGAIQAAGDDVVMIVGNATGALRNDVPSGVTLRDLRRRRVRSALPALVAELRRTRPQCIISTLDHANVLAVIAARIARSGTQPIVRVANTLSQAALNSTRAEAARMRAIRFVYPYASAVIVPADHVASDLVTFAGLPRESIRVIPNPVIDAGFMARRSTALDDPWFASGAPPVILGVGRLVQQKRFDLLIDAFRLVRDRCAARLLIMGEGPERPALEQRVAALGLANEIQLAGFEPNPLRYMSRAEVVASTSSYEGLPAVLVQALACDAKVVATDCPGGTADLLGNGAFGRLVRPGDPAVFADALVEELQSPRRTNDPTSWKPYTVENSVGMYRKLIHTVAVSRAGRHAMNQ